MPAPARQRPALLEPTKAEKAEAKKVRYVNLPDAAMIYVPAKSSAITAQLAVHAAAQPTAKLHAAPADTAAADTAAADTAVEDTAPALPLKDSQRPAVRGQMQSAAEPGGYATPEHKDQVTYEDFASALLGRAAGDGDDDSVFSFVAHMDGTLKPAVRRQSLKGDNSAAIKAARGQAGRERTSSNVGFLLQTPEEAAARDPHTVTTAPEPIQPAVPSRPIDAMLHRDISEQSDLSRLSSSPSEGDGYLPISPPKSRGAVLGNGTTLTLKLQAAVPGNGTSTHGDEASTDADLVAQLKRDLLVRALFGAALAVLTRAGGGQAAGPRVVAHPSPRPCHAAHRRAA